ncbi:MAG: acyl-CoA dehydrogenase [Acidimicrobiales bacterium]|nr:acyl-CoA dehydrogenase [Acidimicrobiales bacterium]
MVTESPDEAVTARPVERAEPGVDDTPAEAEVRAEIRAWMDAHGARFGPSRGPLRPGDTPELVAASRAWQRELDAGGWGAVTWPEAFGGRGFGPNESRIFREEEGRYDVPTGVQHTSIAMVGPTIITHGSPEQHGRLVDPIRTGETLYCQLFSEPDAGSDLASLRTRAERDGDEWVVTGQKIWTSGAHHADKGILLARTDPESRRHDDITYFLIDMRQPGIEVRPIVQINGGRHFNEVYLDEARVHDADRLGAIGDGWKVARTTLSAERVMIGSIRVDDRVERLVAAARAAGRSDDPVLRQALADTWIRAAVLGMTSDRVLGALRSGGTIGPEASILKLSLSMLFGRIGDLAMTVLGPDGLLSGGDDDEPYGPLQDSFLAQWSPRIGGGTEQIQRNLIAERALGLPRDPVP